MTVENIESAKRDLPPIEVYNNPTPQMKAAKEHAEQTLDQSIIMITNNKEQGRSM